MVRYIVYNTISYSRFSKNFKFKFVVTKTIERVLRRCTFQCPQFEILTFFKFHGPISSWDYPLQTYKHYLLIILVWITYKIPLFYWFKTVIPDITCNVVLLNIFSWSNRHSNFSFFPISSPSKTCLICI